MRATIMSKNGHKIVVLNRRRAIHERCLNCVGWYSHEVNNCEEAGCDLHPFRTGLGKQNAKDRSRAIRDFCQWCTNGQISLCNDSTCSLFAYRKSAVEEPENSLSVLKKHDIDGDLCREKQEADIRSFRLGRARKTQ
jgi:hypothetical protein